MLVAEPCFFFGACGLVFFSFENNGQTCIQDLSLSLYAGTWWFELNRCKLPVTARIHLCMVCFLVTMVLGLMA
jgi:hypothetical protein